MIVPQVRAKLNEQKVTDVVLLGIETHVCVQQTTYAAHPHPGAQLKPLPSLTCSLSSSAHRLDLLELGCNVHLCVDAVSSMSTTDRSTGLHRLANAGAFLTTTESVLFELLRSKDHPHFKAVQGIIKESRCDDPLPFM